MKSTFLAFVFVKNVAYDLPHFLAKTFYPYLFSVLKKFPHKFEKLKSVKPHEIGEKKTSPYGHLAKLEPQKSNICRQKLIICQLQTIDLVSPLQRNLKVVL